MKEKLTEHLEKAFRILSAMPVTDENQERVVFAKEELRKAFQLLQTDKEVKTDG